MLALWIGLLAFPYARAFLFLGGPVQMPFGTNFSYISPTEELGAARPKPAITPEISSFVEKLLAEHHVPGTSVGVIRVTEENKVNTEFGAWGNMSEDGSKMTKETLFDIGSCSKAFLASAMGILMDDFALGRNVSALPSAVHTFTWDTKIKDLFPDESEWKLADRWATEKANVRDILNHVSGLPRHDFSYKADDTPADVMRRLRYLKPAYELREQWSYNNQMYVLGAHIISTYSGSPFTSFVKERIFVPLNMSATTYSSREAAQSGLFSQSWTSQGHRRIPFWFDVDSISDLIAGPGGIISSVVDMSKWIATLLNSGVNPETNVPVIPKSTFNETTTAHSIVLGKPPTPEMSILGYGMGWMQSSIQGHQTLSHGGGLPGFLTNVVLFPSDGLGIVALVNSDGPHGVQDIIPSRIFADLLGLHQPSPLASNDRPNDRNHTFSTESDSLTVPLEQYAGTYTNPGYGSFTLCASTNDSQYCSEVLGDFAAIPNAVVPNALYAAWPRAWSSHLRMRHLSGSSFGLSLSTLFPRGYGRDTSPFTFSLFEDIELPVKCVVMDGKVVGCGLDTYDTMKPSKRPEDSVEDWADVWFVKT